MIKVHKPKVEQFSNECKITYQVEVKGKTKELYYVIDRKWQNGLSLELGDGVLVQIFLCAMKMGEDITLEIPVTRRLYYQLKHYLIDALNDADKKWKNIEIIADLVETPKEFKKSDNDEKVVATGMSCGIDSLCTYYTHNYKIENKLNDYKINLLTFFNVGAFHYGDGNAINNEYQKHLELAQSFAAEENLPLLIVNSNLAEIFSMDHDKIFEMRNAGTALLFQNLIDIYYMSSGLPVNSFHCNPNTDAAGYSIYTMQNVSTDALTFYSSNSSYTRFRKTKEIADFPLAHKYLNVCTVNICNCGKCAKCVRTLVTLDSLGKLSEFKDVFDLNLWKKKRDFNIGYVWASKNEKYYNEIYPQLKKRHILSIKNLPSFVLFKIAKPIEGKMKSLSPEKRRSLVQFAEKHHIRVPF